MKLSICCLALFLCAVARADTVAISGSGLIDISGPDLSATNGGLNPAVGPFSVACAGSCVLTPSGTFLFDFDPEECYTSSLATFDGVNANCIKGILTFTGPIGGDDTLSGSVTGYSDTPDGHGGFIVTPLWTVDLSETGTSSVSPALPDNPEGEYTFFEYTFTSTPELPTALLLTVGILLIGLALRR